MAPSSRTILRRRSRGTAATEESSAKKKQKVDSRASGAGDSNDESVKNKVNVDAPSPSRVSPRRAGRPPSAATQPERSLPADEAAPGPDDQVFSPPSASVKHTADKMEWVEVNLENLRQEMIMSAKEPIPSLAKHGWKYGDEAMCAAISSFMKILNGDLNVRNNDLFPCSKLFQKKMTHLREFISFPTKRGARLNNFVRLFLATWANDKWTPIISSAAMKVCGNPSMSEADMAINMKKFVMDAISRVRKKTIYVTFLHLLLTKWKSASRPQFFIIQHNADVASKASLSRMPKLCVPGPIDFSSEESEAKDDANDEPSAGDASADDVAEPNVDNAEGTALSGVDDSEGDHESDE